MRKIFDLTTDKIVEVVIVDNDLCRRDEVLNRFYLVNPDESKLKELKQMIEHRFDYQFDENLSNEEIEKTESFCDNVWDRIGAFIGENFILLEIDRKYEIKY